MFIARNILSQKGDEPLCIFTDFVAYVKVDIADEWEAGSDCKLKVFVENGQPG